MLRHLGIVLALFASFVQMLVLLFPLLLNTPYHRFCIQFERLGHLRHSYLSSLSVSQHSTQIEHSHQHDEASYSSVVLEHCDFCLLQTQLSEPKHWENSFVVLVQHILSIFFIDVYVVPYLELRSFFLPLKQAPPTY